MTKEYLAGEIKLIRKLDERTSQVWEDMKPNIVFRKRVLSLAKIGDSSFFCYSALCMCLPLL